MTRLLSPCLLVAGAHDPLGRRVVELLLRRDEAEVMPPAANQCTLWIWLPVGRVFAARIPTMQRPWMPPSPAHTACCSCRALPTARGRGVANCRP